MTTPLAALERLFSACERGKAAERLEIYADELADVDGDQLSEAVTRILRWWDKPSVPPLGVVRAALGQEQHQPVRDKSNPTLLRYHLERYDDLDGHVFLRHYGYAPTRQTYAKLDVPVPEGVRLQTPPLSVCNAERKRRWAEVRATLERLYSRAARPKS